jgi:hypothetical protein
MKTTKHTTFSMNLLNRERNIQKSISTVLVVNSCLMEQNLYLMLLMFKYAQVNVSGCFFLCSVSSCDFCDNWTHLKCTKITVSEYTKLGKSNETYFCKICTDRLPKFTDSYFGETSFRSNDNVFNLTGSSLSSTRDENNETYDIFNELTEQRKKHPETFTCAYLNINSIRYKSVPSCW